MPRPRRRIATFGVLGGSFLAAIEATIVATAMPTVIEQLGGLAHYSWVFSAYLLTSTVTVPVWGKLSDLYGRRAFYLAAVAFFVGGSALSGAAQSMGALIVFRAIQGIGAGGLLPLGMIILGDLYTLEERARTQALFAMVWGLASIVGPLVGGYITETLSWRWVFYLNLPFGALAALFVGIGLERKLTHGAPRIDYRGAALLASAGVLLLVALSQTGARDRTLASVVVVALYVGVAWLTWLFLRQERRAAEPIVPLGLFEDRLISSALVCGFLVGVAMFGTISFVPLFVQRALGASATQAGSALTPLLLGWVAMSLVTGRVLPRTGHKPLMVSGLALVTLGFVGLMQVGHDSALNWLRVDLGAMGMGMGLTMLTLLLALQNSVSRVHLGVATSLVQFTRSIGGAVGVALMGTIVTASLPPGRDPLPSEVEAALHRAFAAGGMICFLALLSAIRVPREHPRPLAAAAPALPERS